MEIEGPEILWNVKTRWISILEPLERIMGEYKTVIVKTSTDAPTNAATRNNLELRTSLQTLLELPCILTLLIEVNQLINPVKPGRGSITLKKKSVLSLC